VKKVEVEREREKVKKIIKSNNMIQRKKMNMMMKRKEVKMKTVMMKL